MCELQPDFGLHDERVIAVREEVILHIEVYQQNSRDSMRSLGNVPVDVVSKRCREEFTVARTLQTKCTMLLGRVSIHLPAVYRPHALWLVLSDQIRQHAAHAPNYLMSDCDGVKRIETVVCQD